MPITIESYSTVNNAMEVLGKAYKASKLTQITITETDQKFAPPQALKDIWQQQIASAIATIKSETAGW